MGTPVSTMGTPVSTMDPIKKLKKLKRFDSRRPYYGQGMEREKRRVRGWWSEKDKAEHYVYKPITNKDLFLLFFLKFLSIY